MFFVRESHQERIGPSIYKYLNNYCLCALPDPINIPLL